ncbi:MAG: glycosyltransferase family 2 protein [Christensenellales bacterium]
MKKTVSILIPTYNEEENVWPLYKAIADVLQSKCQNYDYEILFIDNMSTDNTRAYLREICAQDKRAKAIFNVKNFGQFNSPFYGLRQTTGDCTILMCADFQDPVDLIPVFLQHWEEGYQIVCGVKTASQENPVMYKLRSMYYRLIKKFSSIDQIEHFTGFGLYDRSFVDVLRSLDDSTPFLRGIVAELGGKRKEVPYEQQKRRAGKTHNNLYTLYDAAMLSFTSYTKIGMRIAVFAGVFFSIVSFLIGLIYLILKLIYWDRFVAGQAPTIIVVSMMCSVLLAFMGFLGEYIAAINTRMMHRPLVVEEERINFEDAGKQPVQHPNSVA